MSKLICILLHDFGSFYQAFKLAQTVALHLLSIRGSVYASLHKASAVLVQLNSTQGLKTVCTVTWSVTTCMQTVKVIVKGRLGL